MSIIVSAINLVRLAVPLVSDCFSIFCLLPVPQCRYPVFAANTPPCSRRYPLSLPCVRCWYPPPCLYHLAHASPLPAPSVPSPPCRYPPRPRRSPLRPVAPRLRRSPPRPARTQSPLPVPPSPRSVPSSPCRYPRAPAAPPPRSPTSLPVPTFEQTHSAPVFL